MNSLRKADKISAKSPLYGRHLLEVSPYNNNKKNLKISAESTLNVSEEEDVVKSVCRDICLNILYL